MPEPDFIPVGPAIGADGVSLEAIRLMHRSPAGEEARHWVPFVHERESFFRDVASFSLAEIFSMLPFFQEHLAENAYHGVNGMGRAGQAVERGKRKYTLLPGLNFVCRENAAASLITACWADLDIHERGIGLGQAIGAVVEAQVSGRIPRASLLVCSGRGLWVLWLVKDAGGALTGDGRPAAQRATEADRALHRRIEDAIVSQTDLAALGADAQAKDLARLMRLLGSINSKAGAPVLMLPMVWGEGGLPFYTLSELAALWNVQVLPPRSALALVPRPAAPTLVDQLPFESGPAKTAKQPKYVALARLRWRYRFDDFNTLRELRGGRFQELTRQFACLLLATLARKVGVPTDDIVAAVHELARVSFTGAGENPDVEARKALRSAFRYADTRNGRGATAAERNRNGSWPDWRIANCLRITPEEAARLDRLPAAGPPPVPRQRRKRTTAARQAALVAIVASVGLLSTRVLARRLRERGFPCSHMTVERDIAALGLRPAVLFESN